MAKKKKLVCKRKIFKVYVDCIDEYGNFQKKVLAFIRSKNDQTAIKEFYKISEFVGVHCERIFILVSKKGEKIKVSKDIINDIKDIDCKN